MFYIFMRASTGVFLRRSLSLFICTAFLLTSVVPASYAQSVFNLPQPGTMIGLSDAFAPVVLKGISIHPEDPLLFDFMIDNGHSRLQGQALTDETTKLVKYFLAGLSVPEKDLWVNLSPAEKGRIMADDLSHTDVGREMLAQDYVLKQITSSLMYPEKDLGRKFWDQVYQQTYQKFGHIEVPVDSFNKVWITPGQATVYQNGNNAFITRAHLKVMLEMDYLSATSQPADASEMKAGADIARQVVREVILPVLEQEVNEGRNFAALRQVFQSMILAGWYKNALKTSLLNQIYANTNKVSGIDIPQKDAREKVYAQYMEAYQKGVYNYIKEEFDQNTRETISRKYFSGGINDMSQAPEVVMDKASARQVVFAGSMARLSYKMKTLQGVSWTDDAQAVNFDQAYLNKDIKFLGYGPASGRVTGRGAVTSYLFSGHDNVRWELIRIDRNAEKGADFNLIRTSDHKNAFRYADLKEEIDMARDLKQVLADVLRGIENDKVLTAATEEEAPVVEDVVVEDAVVAQDAPAEVSPAKKLVQEVLGQLTPEALSQLKLAVEFGIPSAFGFVNRLQYQSKSPETGYKPVKWTLVLNSSEAGPALVVLYRNDQPVIQKTYKKGVFFQEPNVLSQFIDDVRATGADDAQISFEEDYLKRLTFLGNGPASGRVNSNGAVTSYLFSGNDSVKWELIQVNKPDVKATDFQLKRVSDNEVVLTYHDSKGDIDALKDPEHVMANVVTVFQRKKKTINVQINVDNQAFIEQAIETYIVDTYKNIKESLVFWIGGKDKVELARTSELEKLIAESKDATAKVMAALIAEEPNALQKRFKGALSKIKVFEALIKDVAAEEIIIAVEVTKKPVSDDQAQAFQDMAGMKPVVQGGIDLGQGDYLQVIATDAAGMPQFDPAQIQMLQKDLRGIVPIPVGVPQSVDLRLLLGLEANAGHDDLQLGSRQFMGEELPA